MVENSDLSIRSFYPFLFCLKHALTRAHFLSLLFLPKNSIFTNINSFMFIKYDPIFIAVNVNHGIIHHF